MHNEFDNIFNNKTVLVTGHTGFKGSWLSIWLEKLGAKVIGYSLDEYPTNPCNFQLTNLSERIIDVRGDIRDFERFKKVVEKYKPEIVFHLAGQPILFEAYNNPKKTFDTNAGGTVNVLEAIRQTKSVKVLVSITTDKVYKNNEWVWGYRENDAFGDSDPYAASKSMAEFAIAAYRNSFFSGKRPEDREVSVAVTRAGNVIGGGDFGMYRLIPDCMRALMDKKPIELRQPSSVRPWQHVLEPLSGYLWLAAKMYQDPFGTYNKAWNFGPLKADVTAEAIADKLIDLWGSGTWINVGGNESKKENTLLMLDWSAAKHELGWSPVYNSDETLEEIVRWFKEYDKHRKLSGKKINMYDMCSAQIDKYTKKAESVGLEWAKPSKQISA